MDSLKQGVPQVSLPDLGGGELGENVEQAQAQLGQFFSSKLSEVGGALSGQTEKVLEEAGKALGPALDPAKPYLEQLNSQLSVVKDLTQKVSQEVIKDQGVIVERASPIVQGLSKYGTPRNLFNAENLAVLPLWASIILAPNNRLVKGFMKSYIPIVLAAFVYVWLTYLAFNDPVSLEGFSGMSDLSVLTKVRLLVQPVIAFCMAAPLTAPPPMCLCKCRASRRRRRWRWPGPISSARTCSSAGTSTSTDSGTTSGPATRSPWPFFSARR